MEKKQKFIPKVDGNRDKENTYRKLHEHYIKSFTDGYYLEAMVLVYAMLEDRFNGILRALEIADYGEKSLVVTSGIEKELFTLLNPKSNEDKGINEFISISGKYSVIKKLATINSFCPERLLDRKQIVISADNNRKIRGKTGEKSKSIKKIISEIEDWNRTRNQYIHALFNKKYDVAMARLPKHDEEGLELARELDNFCNRVKTQAKKNLYL